MNSYLKLLKLIRRNLLLLPHWTKKDVVLFITPHFIWEWKRPLERGRI